MYFTFSDLLPQGYPSIQCFQNLEVLLSSCKPSICQLYWHHLLDLAIFHEFVITPLLYIKFLYLCKSIVGLIFYAIVFPPNSYSCFNDYYFIISLEFNMVCNTILFFYKNLFDFLGPLKFYINIKISWQVSGKTVGIYIRLALKFFN